MNLSLETKLSLISAGHNPDSARKLSLREASKKIADICDTKYSKELIYLFSDREVLATLRIPSVGTTCFFSAPSLAISDKAGDFQIDPFEAGTLQFTFSKQGARRAIPFFHNLSEYDFSLYIANGADKSPPQNGREVPKNYDAEIHLNLSKGATALYWGERMNDSQTADLYWRTLCEGTGFNFRKDRQQCPGLDTPLTIYVAEKEGNEVKIIAPFGTTEISAEFSRPYNAGRLKEALSNLAATFQKGESPGYVVLHDPRAPSRIKFFKTLQQFH